MINYYLLTKPGIILGNLFTVAAGFMLATGGRLDFWLFSMVMVGLAFVMGSACVFNNYFDRGLDRKMERTKHRPLAIGLISEENAIAFGVLLGLAGFSILFLGTNLLTVLVAAIGFFDYIFLYTLWKGRTLHGTAIGSVAGAVPPVVGYCAVSNSFDAGAAILFTMMVLWQMPHFYSIAVWRMNDYAAAGIPVLPLEKGVPETKVHMAMYIVGFILASALLTVFGYTGQIFLAATTTAGLLWLGLCLAGFKRDDDTLWARQMFRLSLAPILVICLMIPIDARL